MPVIEENHTHMCKYSMLYYSHANQPHILFTVSCSSIFTVYLIFQIRHVLSSQCPVWEVCKRLSAVLTDGRSVTNHSNSLQTSFTLQEHLQMRMSLEWTCVSMFWYAQQGLSEYVGPCVWLCGLILQKGCNYGFAPLMSIIAYRHGKRM